MALSDRLHDDLRAAMKARDTDAVATLRLTVAALTNARVAEGHRGDLSDAETLEVLAKEAKKRAEAAHAYRAAGRQELADKELRELAVLRRYLPEQLDEQQLHAIVDEAITQTGASGPGDLGRVMAAVMPRVKGRADGRQVNAIVRGRLGAPAGR